MTVKKARRKLIVQYCGSFKMQPSFTSILDSQFGLIYKKGHFGGPLRYLMKSPLSLGKEYRFTDQNLYKSLSEAIQSTKCPKSKYLSQTDFLARSGRLVLYLAVPHPDDNRHQVNHNDFECSVLSGVWLSALAAAALVNNEIDGLILDTKFKVILQCHTAILLAIIHNMRLPLGLSFGSQESIDLYDHFYMTFRGKLGID
jgi:hypothetical protein